MNAGEDYASILDRYNDFQECILLDYWSANLCRDLVVLIHNIWEGRNQMRADLDQLAPVQLEFKQCRRILVENVFPASALQNPELANWALNEFAIVRVLPTPEGTVLAKFLWEDQRFIEIESASLEVREVKPNSEMIEKYRW